MTLNTGARVGPFEILSPLGAGGMGEVYRARDSKLGRDVALKVLPAALAGSSERLARLQREARLLASLNHPHIAAIYGLEETDGGCALVMELVEGLTLQARLAQGALPPREALEVARQIAEALEYAHEHGIVHRDLKPGNVKLTPQGSVKVLDFGLAKALSDEPLSPDESSSPTATSDPTGEGVVLGTAAYMSPEQAQGKAVDRRTDIWSFGVLLYELLTGKRLFARATGPETLAQVIAGEPDLSRLPSTTPPSLLRLLRRCLEKDRTQRLQAIGDARLEIEEAAKERSAGSSVAAGASRRTWLWTGGLIAATAIGGLLAALLLRTSPNALTTVRRLTLALPKGVALYDPENNFQHLAVSPDGRRVAFMGAPDRSEGGRNEGSLYVQGIDDIEARAIPGTEGAWNPFFSQDGLWLAFGHGRRIRKVRLDVGEAPVTIADIPKVGSLRGASWGADGTIFFTPGAYEGLWQVPANGGTPRALTQPDAGHGEVSHRWPQVLPGGHYVIFTNQRHGVQTIWQESRLALLSLATGKWRDIVEGTGFGRYSPTGHLVFARLGMLFAVPFDLARGEASGPAAPVLDDVQMNLVGHLYADFDVSASGSLLYMPGFKRTIARSLLWVDRLGQARPVSSARRDYARPRVSPDGRQLVVSIELDAGSPANLWRLDVEKDAWTRLTFGGGADAEWSPDARWLAFAKPASQELMRMPSDGSAPPERLSGFPMQSGFFYPHPNGWSADGREVLFSVQRRGAGWDIGTLPLETREPRWLLSAPFAECCAALSPDGHFMAYLSGDSGRMNVYVRPYPGSGGERHVISSEGGMQPRWSRDGRELYYRGFGDHPKLMVVPVETRGRFRAGAPRPLFDDVYSERAWTFARAAYDVMPDGRFVFVEEPPAAPAPNRLVLIPDWKRELEGKLRAARP